MEGLEALAACGGVPGALADWPGLRRPQHLDLQQFLDVLNISPLAPPAVLEVAKRAHVIPYPPHWSEEVDVASGALYFYHELRDEASWQHPMWETMSEVLRLIASLLDERLNLGLLSQRIETVLAETQHRAAEELADWVGPISGGEDGGAYYYNRSTGLSEWEDPRERWRFDLQVRYELLVGFLVSEERAETARFGPGSEQQTKRSRMPTDLTPTLTSLASTMSSVASLLDSSLTTPADVEAAAATEANGPATWARPRPARRGGLPLPPRATTSTRSLRDGGNTSAVATTRALFVMPPHQQHYASKVRHQEPSSPEASGHPARCEQPPPPPPGDPPPRKGF